MLFVASLPKVSVADGSQSSRKAQNLSLSFLIKKILTIEEID